MRQLTYFIICSSKTEFNSLKYLKLCFKILLQVEVFFIAVKDNFESFHDLLLQQ